MSYTVMGDGVNIAARLEGINKEYGTAHLHQPRRLQGSRRAAVRAADRRRRGQGSPRPTIPIYELVGVYGAGPEFEPTRRRVRLCKLTRAGVRGAGRRGLRAGARALPGDRCASFPTIPSRAGMAKRLAAIDPSQPRAAADVALSDARRPQAFVRRSRRCVPANTRRRLIQALRAEPVRVRGARVLEIGSGSGVVLAALGALGAASLCGVDIEEDAIATGAIAAGRARPRSTPRSTRATCGCRWPAGAST